MDILQFLHSVGQERFPFYLSKEQAIELYNETPERDIELYNNTIEDFIDTGEVKDIEMLKFAINHLFLFIHASSDGQEQEIK